MMIVEQTHEEFDLNNTGRHKDKDINRQFLVTATSAENDNTTSNNQNNILSSKDTFSKSVIDTKCMPTKPPLIKVTKKESPIKDQNGESFTLSPWRKSPYPFTPNQGQSHSFRYLSQIAAAQYPIKNDTVVVSDDMEVNKSKSFGFTL